MKRGNKVKKAKFDFVTLLICLIIVFVVVGGIGSIFTTKNVHSEWYQSIQPSITPPSWVFPVAWNFLFATIGFSLYFAWTRSKNKNQREKVAIIFAINFILNILWSIIFFGLKQPKIAFFEVVVFWLSILAMILVTRKISKESSCLLIPYLVWVAFASFINYLAAFA
jgi:translocator protein